MHNLHNYTVLCQKLQSEAVENRWNRAWINKKLSTCLHAVPVDHSACFISIIQSTAECVPVYLILIDI